MNEPAGIAAAFYDWLAASPRLAALLPPSVLDTSTLAIFEDVAPDDQDYPFVLFSQVSPGNTLGFIGSGGRVAIQPLYLVKGVSRSRNFAEADRIASALDAALTNAAGTFSFDGERVQVKAVHQETPHRRTETANTITYRHAGGFYRLMAHGVE